MRPGHFCPGNPSWCSLAIGARSSFNEAGAFLPRKRDGVQPGTASRRGFNEAGAFLPRKLPPASRAALSPFQLQ